MLQSCAARLTGSEIPSFADAEKTLPELQDRIAKTVAYLKPFNPSQFDGSAERIITMNIRRKPVTLDGKTYLLAFSLPNFFFYPHVRHSNALPMAISLPRSATISASSGRQASRAHLARASPLRLDRCRPRQS